MEEIERELERETVDDTILEMARMDRNTDQQPGKICPLLQQRRGIKKLDNNSFRYQPGKKIHNQHFKIIYNPKKKNKKEKEQKQWPENRYLAASRSNNRTQGSLHPTYEMSFHWHSPTSESWSIKSQSFKTDRLRQLAQVFVNYFPDTRTKRQNSRKREINSERGRY